MTRIYVPPHKRVTKDGIQNVDSYWRRGKSVSKLDERLAISKLRTSIEPPRESWPRERFSNVVGEDWGTVMWPVPTGWPDHPDPDPDTEAEWLGKRGWIYPDVKPDYQGHDKQEIEYQHEIVSQVKAEGMRKPVQLVEDPKHPGTYLLANGHHRYLAALRLQMDVPVQVWTYEAWKDMVKRKYGKSDHTISQWIEDDRMWESVRQAVGSEPTPPS